MSKECQNCNYFGEKIRPYGFEVWCFCYERETDPDTDATDCKGFEEVD